MGQYKNVIPIECYDHYINLIFTYVHVYIKNFTYSCHFPIPPNGLTLNRTCMIMITYYISSNIPTKIKMYELIEI